MNRKEIEIEAEKYGIENYESCIYDDVKGWETDIKARKQSFKDGAEFVHKENKLTEVTEWNGKPRIMKIHVICCNDAVEFAVVDDESKAIEKLKELADEHFLKNIHAFADRQEYKNRCYWHIHTVAGAYNNGFNLTKAD